MMKHFLYILLALATVSCQDSKTGPYMAAAPDYSDAQMWYISEAEAEAEAEADVFYILPTCVWDWTDSEGRTCHYADVYNPEHIAALLPSNQLADEIFGEYAERFPHAMDDVFRAFELYMHNMNEGKPFVIAGFSQGAKCVVELVKSLDEKEMQRLVAAYVIGYKVTEEDLQGGKIKPAQSCSDTGVTICYNSVESPECVNPGLSPSEICINPVNWRCDPEPATVQDVKGLDSDKYYHPSLGNLFVKGNYHLLELELYKESLKENVRQRIENLPR